MLGRSLELGEDPRTPQRHRALDRVSPANVSPPARPAPSDRFAIADRVQHPTRTGAQQIRHHTRDLDVGFLEERLQPVVELHAVHTVARSQSPHWLDRPRRSRAHSALNRFSWAFGGYRPSARLRKSSSAASQPCTTKSAGCVKPSSSVLSSRRSSATYRGQAALDDIRNDVAALAGCVEAIVCALAG